MTESKPEKIRTDFLTVSQLAEVLQVSQSTVNRLRRSGRIPFVTVTDRIIRFHLRDVKHALAAAKQKGDGSITPADNRAEDETQLSFEDLLKGDELEQSEVVQ